MHLAITWGHISSPESWPLPSPQLSCHPAWQPVIELDTLHWDERDGSALTSLEQDVERVGGKRILCTEVPSP